jgi:hypothetical protein
MLRPLFFNRQTRSRSAAIGISLYFVFLVHNYAQATPIFEASDEAAHFLYIHTLIEQRQLPIILSREQIAAAPTPAERWSIEAHQPPLYYAVGALLIAWTDRSDLDAYLRPNDLIFVRGETANNHHQWLHSPTRGGAQTGLAVTILRLYSLSLGVGTLWVVYLTALLTLRSTTLALLAMLLTTSVPSFVAISGSINNDNLTTLLYSAGLYWIMRCWQNALLIRRDMLAGSAVLALIALTKVNGLSLFGLVDLVLLVGVRHKRWSGRRALQFAGLSLTITLGLAGWWYARNVQLYGDPLALEATASLWSRAYEIAPTSGDPMAELTRIFRSFWMMVGYLHLPVYGPVWVSFYAALITLAALVGLIVGWQRGGLSKSVLLILLLACAVVIVTLLVGTRSVDISYGRLLFPMLAAFVPLLIAGWRMLLPRALSFLPIVPLILAAMLMPLDTLRSAYPRLTAVTASDAGGVPVQVDAEGLNIVSYRLLSEIAAPDEEIRLTLDIQGQHSQNPFLAITAVDPVTLDSLGYASLYPGLAPTDALDPEQVYRTLIGFHLDPPDAQVRQPRRVLLRLEWITPVDGRSLMMRQADGSALEALLVNGPTWIDPRYEPEAPQFPARMTFGGQGEPAGAIALTGYGFDRDPGDLSAGDALHIDLHWRAQNPLADDWSLTVQLLDAAGGLIAQDDGSPAGYPTSAWRAGTEFVETRTLVIPPDAAPGTHRIWVGWYRLADFQRLTAQGYEAANNLYPLETTVMLNLHESNP